MSVELIAQTMETAASCSDTVTCGWSLARGLLIGLAVAMPVGPIAILCLQYALHRGFMVAFAAGLGAALADACFGILAGMGLTAVTEWVIVNRCWIQMAGGAFLCYLGAEILLTRAHTAPMIDHQASATSAFCSTFLLTLANPMTIFAFMALFGYFGFIKLADSPVAAITALTGVFIGSLLWWTLLAACSSRLRSRVSEKGLMQFREIGGAAFILFGILAFLKCF